MKTAIVIGSSGSIGQSIVKYLENDFIIEGISSHHLINQCDITDWEQTRSTIINIANKHSTIDALINSAGVVSKNTIENLDDNDALRLFKINAIGALHVSRAILPFMQKQGFGHIIHIGSLRATQYDCEKAAYSMSKAAMRAFCLTLAQEAEPYGIKTILISPGAVNTNIYRRKDWKPKPEITQPDDIAKIIDLIFKLPNSVCIREIEIGKLLSVWN